MFDFGSIDPKAFLHVFVFLHPYRFLYTKSSRSGEKRSTLQYETGYRKENVAMSGRECNFHETVVMNKLYQIIATFFATVVQQGVQNRKFHSGNFPITFRRGRRIPISALISCSQVSSIPDYQYPSHLFNAAFFGFVIIFVALRCILESWSSSIFLMGCLLRFLFTVDPPSKQVTRTL
jgi:hypothetical protein